MSIPHCTTCGELIYRAPSGRWVHMSSGRNGFPDHFAAPSEGSDER